MNAKSLQPVKDLSVEVEQLKEEADELIQKFEQERLPSVRWDFLIVINQILEDKKNWKNELKDEINWECKLEDEVEEVVEDGKEWDSLLQQAKNKTGELTEEMIEYYDGLILKIKEELNRLKSTKVLKKSNKDKIWSVEELVDSEKIDLSKIWNLNSILLRLKKIPNIVEFEKLSWLIKELIKKFPNWILKKKSKNKSKGNWTENSIDDKKLKIY